MLVGYNLAMGEITGKSGRRDQIVTAACACFRQHGVEGTTLEMIAEAAGLARPNLYRYFKSKTELVTAVIGREARVFNAERWAQTRRLRSFRARIVRSLQLAARLVHSNPLWADLNRPSGVPYTALATTSDPDVIRANQEYWLPILERASSRGELPAHLDFEEVMRWLLGLEFLFVEREELFPDDRAIERYVNQFVVPALCVPEG